MRLNWYLQLYEHGRALRGLVDFDHINCRKEAFCVFILQARSSSIRSKDTLCPDNAKDGNGGQEIMDIHKRLDVLIERVHEKVRDSKSSLKSGTFSKPVRDQSFSSLDSNDVYKIIMKYHKQRSKTTIETLEMELDKTRINLTPELVVEVLNKCGAAGKPAFRFFMWAGNQPGYKHSRAVYRAMINAVCRMGDFMAAWGLLEEMRKADPGLVNPDTFVIMMRRFAAKRMVDKAVNVLYEMPKFGCEPDSDIFGCLLDALCKRNHVNEALALFGDMKVKFPPNLKNYTVVINGLCKTGRIEEALHLFKQMLELGFKPDLVVYNTLLDGFDKAGMISEAFDLLNEMKRRDCPPNTTSYTSLVHALSVAQRFEEAFRVFDNMKNEGCFPDVVAYTTLIAGLCKAGRLDRAYQVMDEMIQQGCAPNQMTYFCLLREHERREEIYDALELVKEMSQNGCYPDLPIYNTLIRLSYKLELPDKALEIWNDMEHKGITADLDTYIIFIHGLIDSKNLTGACNYFKEMVGKGLLPSPQYGTLKRLWNDLLRAKRLNDACELWECMKNSNCHANIHSYTIWIQALCSADEVLEASGYCADMIEAGLLPQPSTYQMIMKGLRKLYNRRVAEDIRGKIRKLISEKNLPFKSYATQGRMKLAERNSFRKRGKRR